MRPRRGFSLIELLVVLAILTLVSGIGVAAWQASQKVNRLAGTETLITSVLRQARYTARATGQAVLLYVDKDARTITGTSRLALLQAACEKYGPPFDLGPSPNPPGVSVTAFLAPTGRTGNGLGRTATTGATDEATLPLFDPAGTGDERSPNRQLTRSRTKPTEGFAFSCAVHPPVLPPPGTSLPGMTPPDQCVPLLLVGSSSAVADSYAGVALRQALRPLYAPGDPDGNDSQIPAAASPATPPTGADRVCWEAVGWVFDESGAVHVVAGLADAVKDGSETAQPDPSIAHRVSGDIGGRWEEIGLVFTGTSLELFRDGVRIARSAVPAGTRVRGNAAKHQLTIGSAEGDGTILVNGPTYLHEQTCIDDVALFRLGADEPRGFPNGVEPADTYRIAIMPDGRATALQPAPGPAGITWRFSGVFVEKDDYAEVNISATRGSVTLNPIHLDRSAP